MNIFGKFAPPGAGTADMAVKRFGDLGTEHTKRLLLFIYLVRHEYKGNDRRKADVFRNPKIYF